MAISSSIRVKPELWADRERSRRGRRIGVTYLSRAPRSPPPGIESRARPRAGPGTAGRPGRSAARLEGAACASPPGPWPTPRPLIRARGGGRRPKRRGRPHQALLRGPCGRGLPGRRPAAGSGRGIRPRDLGPAIRAASAEPSRRHRRAAGPGGPGPRRRRGSERPPTAAARDLPGPPVCKAGPLGTRPCSGISAPRRRPQRSGRRSCWSAPRGTRTARSGRGRRSTRSAA